MDAEEQAADPLAGGILQQGYQCGMLWGATLALGAESFRRTGSLDQTIPLAVASSRHVMQSFTKMAKSTDCLDITDTDWQKKWSIFKYMIRGKMLKCFGLADKWAPQALQAAKEGLAMDPEAKQHNPASCAAEAVARMGGSESEQAIVSGLAGGLGLSGNGCGALAAVIWKSTLDRVRQGAYKYSLSDPALEKILLTFYAETDSEMACRDICGETFNSLAEHTDFIRGGGCRQLIDRLAGALDSP